ncbi:hypothetical protein [Bdellovibrio sp. HCB337]|uniref:hypothetical protein n=1 Tax=Bdellovibrio sp. HCB337 TaxID=3394358 RepID=UPI0039A46B3D
MKKIFLLSFLISFLGVSLAFANPPEYTELSPWPRFDINFSAGAARQTGYLTTESSVGTYILGVNMEAGAGMMSFEWNGFSVDHDTGEFPLNNNKRVQVATFSFIPQFKVLDRDAWNVFLGFGLSQVGLYQYDPNYTTIYGSYIFSGVVRYRISNRWSAHFKSQWYGVRQTLAGQSTSFEVWNNVLGFGVNLF